MTAPECPKGPEREARPEESLLAQVVEQFRVRWGYAEVNELIKRYARDAIEVLSPELERLTAEVERLRKHEAELAEVRAELVKAEPKADETVYTEPMYGRVETVEIVRALAASRNSMRRNWGRCHERHREAEAEVSRLREQLAAQTLLPDNAEVLVSQWLLDHNGTQYADYHETRPAARDLISFVLQWGIHYAAVESSAQEQAPIVHTVLLSSDTGVMGEWQAFCAGCEQGSKGDLAHAEFWKDQHLADVLVPTLTNESSISQQDACSICGSTEIQYQPFSGGKEYYCPSCEDVHPYDEGRAPRRAQMLQDGKFDALKQEMRDHFEGRPSGSKAAAPQAVEAPEVWSESPDDADYTATYETQLIPVTVAEDAAQAAGSEATHEDPPVQSPDFQVGDEVRWCWSGKNADGTWFNARLTEKHPHHYPKGWAGEITDCGTAYTDEHMGEVPLGFKLYMDIPSLTLVSRPSPSLRKEGEDSD